MTLENPPLINNLLIVLGGLGIGWLLNSVKLCRFQALVVQLISTLNSALSTDSMSIVGIEL